MSSVLVMYFRNKDVLLDTEMFHTHSLEKREIAFRVVIHNKSNRNLTVNHQIKKNHMQLKSLILFKYATGAIKGGINTQMDS